MSKILGRGDIAWSSKPAADYRFGGVQVSADGRAVLFTAACEFCQPAEARPFLVRPDGSGLQDLVGMLPATITSRWSGWRNLLVNDDGSKVFFRAVVAGGYYGDEYLYVYDVPSATTGLAVNRKFSPLGSGWHFRIDADGDRVYLDKYNAGWDETLKKSRRGLFAAATGGPLNWYFDIDDLSCQSECGNLNLFSLLGIAARSGRAFFAWNSDYWQTDGSDRHTGFYATDGGGHTLLGGEHYWIAAGDQRGIADAEGRQVIYRYRHEKGGPQELALVDVGRQTARVVAWTSGLNGFSAHLSRSGRYALVNGEYGDRGAYYQTLLDLEAGSARDTWSYYLPGHVSPTSNLTADDRYYFYTYDGSQVEDAAAGLYRIDTRPDGDDRAPRVEAIAFSAPVLLDREGSTVAVRVRVSDPQGLGNLDWVRLLPLVAGQETTPWPMGREPLAFPTGDAGSTRLYDDGTHGDQVAGDGIYTFDRIATRKGDRGPEGWNSWYRHYSLPADLGIRIVVKDRDHNFALADTVLRLSDDPADLPPAAAANAAPAAALAPVDFQPDSLVDPTAAPVAVGACAGVVIRPTLAVPAADVGRPAQLFMYLYLPAAGLGFNLPGKSQVLAAATTIDLLARPLDFSAYPGLNFYVYCGYLLEGVLRYNAYAVTVQSGCTSP
ncbi:MAG: hypothetical protein JRJ56_09105 [Deltaproteobacteria bacterium]|nr:hypothetical protein [Deltaproteobacteria bacterium]